MASQFFATIDAEKAAAFKAIPFNPRHGSALM